MPYQTSRTVDDIMNDDAARPGAVWKHLHQHHQLAKTEYYALDLDLTLVAKKPTPGMVAALDHKDPSGSVSFSEVIAYNHFHDLDIPVFIIKSTERIKHTPVDEQRFNIYRYKPSPVPVPYPPVVNKTLIEEELNWKEFFEWEERVRRIIPTFYGGGDDD